MSHLVFNQFRGLWVVFLDCGRSGRGESVERVENLQVGTREWRVLTGTLHPWRSQLQTLVCRWIRPVPSY